MNRTRGILFIDTETTGVDPVVDRLIELGISVLAPSGEVKHRGLTRRFNPGIPIPPEATAVHGITDEMVRDCKPFADYAVKVQALFRGRDIGGYNVFGLDLAIIDQELRRCDLKLELDPDVRIIDCFGIFSKKEPRKLEDAVRRYCNRDHADAHGAGSDAAATLDVFLGQMAAYPDLDCMSLAEVAAFAARGDNQPVDLAGKLYRDKDGFVCYAFGKQRGQRVVDEPGFAEWALRCSNPPFPGSTRDALIEELKRLETNT